MKTLTTTLMIALSLGLTTFASATEDRESAKSKSATTYQTTIYASPLSPSTLRVNVQKESGKSMIINIKDDQHNTLASQYITKKSGTFAAKFDLSQLEDGTYQVEVFSGNEVTTKSITLKTTSSSINRSVSVKL